MRSKPATQYIAWRNRMRTQHPNLWHPIRFAIMLIVLAWTIYGVCYEPPTDISGVIWVAMLATALVLSPLFLKSTSVAILVIASIGDLFTPYAHLGNSLPAQLYAYGMLAYSTNAIIVATLLTYYVVNILLIDPPGPNTNPVAMVGMYAMVLLLGRALSWSEKTTQKSFEAAQNKNRLQELESRTRIADAIHDAVTGDLSAAAFVAQRHIGGNSSGPGVAADPANATTTTATTTSDAEDWRQINEYILSALTNVHRVIDELNMAPPLSPATPTAKRCPICCEQHWMTAIVACASLASISRPSGTARAASRAHRKQSPNLPIICCARSMRISHAMPLRKARSIFR